MQRALPFIVFAIVLGLARVFGAMTSDSLVNFQPLGALFFCGMALFGWRGLVLPALAWMVTLPFTNIAQGYVWYSTILTPLLGFAAMIALARLFKNASPAKVFFGSLTSAIAFYFITNTLSWVFDPLYGSKSFATWFQALTVGLPQFTIPTWVFFRNALLAQGLFSAVFLFATRAVPLAYSKRVLQTAS